eukprot:TRINITY_DN17225_c0_g1_i1.p1 TRINITY_DN17225_c0_g1~~TRINITY_DN17225_c0_g1_i1.p1  ORF type:complete len:109 (-),score=5.82 TRINITY_DN17225_c0_g1_i1:66-392(-)
MTVRGELSSDEFDFGVLVRNVPKILKTMKFFARCCADEDVEDCCEPLFDFVTNTIEVERQQQCTESLSANYTIRWTVQHDEYIEVELDVHETDVWIGIGFSNYPYKTT